MIADSREDRASTSPLQRIIPIVLLIGSLGYILAWLTKDADPWLFLQIAAIGALFVYFLTFVDVILGLAILIGCIGLSPRIGIGGIENLRLEDFIIPGLLLAWVLRGGRNREPLARIEVGTPAVAYFLAVLLSSLLGVASGTIALSGALEVIGKYIEYFALFLLIANNVRTEQEFKALAVFSILVAIASALFSAGMVNQSAVGSRINGPSGETANIYGGYLVLNLALAIGFFLHAPTAAGRGPASIAIILLGLPLLQTLSRTSAAALALALFLFGLLKERRVMVLLIILGALVPVVASDMVLQRLETIAGLATGTEPASWSSRMESWQESVPRVLTGNPLLGFGAGSVRRGDVDSEYVRVLVDGGILGLALFCWLLARGFRLTFFRYDDIPGPGFHKGFAAGFMIAFFALCIHAVAATSFTAIRTAEMFMVLAGLYVCQMNHLAEWTAPAPAAPPMVAPSPAPAIPPRSFV